MHPCAQAVVNSCALPNKGGTDPAQAALGTGLQILFGIVGVMAVLIIVISGFRYITAHGDPSAVATARRSLVYALVGLVISLAAFSIVTLVLKGVST
ncbi:MAG TPA: pilin [Candidatus Saccharimonadales bacterium]|nr:pilin [Candidatus Saccharimonadales bacterium]